MSESTKIFVPDGGSESNTLIAMLPSLLQQRGIDPSVLALCKNKDNNTWSDLIALVIVAAIFGNGFGGFGGFGGRGFGGGYVPNMINNDSNTQLLMQMLQRNGTDINTLATALNTSNDAIIAAINSVGRDICSYATTNGQNFNQVLTALMQGNNALATQLAGCCCDLRTAITQQGYQSQLGQKDIQNTMLNGFSQVGYATRDQTCSLENAIKGLGTQMANQFAALETRSLQDKLQAERDANTALKNQLSNEHQTAIFGQQIAQATAPIVASLNAVSKEVDDIKCKLPESVTIPYSPVVGVPSCVAYNAALYGLGGGFPFAQQGGNVFS